MATCAFCGTTVLFGGKKSAGLRFCSAKCEQRSPLVSAMAEVPAEITQKYAESLHGGNCPKCGGQGPVDVHTSYRVWSMIVLTRWESKREICCQACGNKSRVLSLGYSALLGWWGFPWGLVITPIQVTQNLVGLIRHPDPTKPSAELLTTARLDLAKKVLQTRQQGNAQT